MGYTKRDLEQENFTACNSYLSKQITQVSEGKRLMTSAVVYDSNSDFPDGNIRSVYSSIGNTFSSMYSDNITDTIALGRCRFNTNNDEVTRTGTMGEILSELDKLVSEAKALSAKYSGMQSGIMGPDSIIMPLPDDRIEEIKDGNLVLSADKQYIYIDGIKYKIVTSPYSSYPHSDGPAFNAAPQELKKIYIDGSYFDWAAAFANGFSMNSVDDMASAAGGKYEYGNSGNFMIPDTGLGTLFDCLNIANNFVTAGRKEMGVTLTFYEAYQGEKVVTIGVNSSDYTNAVERYAGSTRAYVKEAMRNGADGAALLVYSNSARDIYEKVTGNQTNISSYYDFRITMDPAHKNDEYAMMLYFDDNGNMMSSTNIYPGDKYQIVEMSGLFYNRETVLYETTPSSVGMVDPKVQEVFMNGIVNGFNDLD